MRPEDIKACVNEAAKLLKIDLPVQADQRLADYALALHKWNQTYNLTALRTVEEILVQHLLDCMAAAPAVTRFFDRTKPQSGAILDVGSGAGLPGVVFAILLPNIRVICVDAVQKKVAFVNYVVGQIGTKNILAIHDRVETMPSAGVDLVVSRAFASLNAFAKLSGRHLKVGGRLLALKARRVDEDLAQFEHDPGQAWRVVDVEEIQVPQMKAKRCLVWLDRKNDDE